MWRGSGTRTSASRLALSPSCAPPCAAAACCDSHECCAAASAALFMIPLRRLSDLHAAGDLAWFQFSLDRLRALRRETDPRLREFFADDAPLYIARAPGRLDVMGGIADYSGAHVTSRARRGASTSWAGSPTTAGRTCWSCRSHARPPRSCSGRLRRAATSRRAGE